MLGNISLKAYKPVSNDVIKPLTFYLLETNIVYYYKKYGLLRWINTIYTFAHQNVVKLLEMHKKLLFLQCPLKLELLKLDTHLWFGDSKIVFVALKSHHNILLQCLLFTSRKNSVFKFIFITQTLTWDDTLAIRGQF